jgi:hypothetical protein
MRNYQADNNIYILFLICFQFLRKKHETRHTVWPQSKFYHKEHCSVGIIMFALATHAIFITVIQ